MQLLHTELRPRDDARPEQVLDAARQFLRNGVAPQGGAQLAAPKSNTTLHIDASHHMVLERLSLEHSEQLRVINDDLQRLQEEHRKLLDKYEDLQVSSALQMKEILARRDAILDSLRLETANRVAKEKVLQQATAVIQRLTGRKFTELTAEDMGMELHQVSNEVVIQQAHVTALNKANIKARMQRLVKVDVEMRCVLV